MDLETFNDYENEANSKIDEEVDFEKEFYHALAEIKRLTRKNQYMKEKLSHNNEES